MLEHIPQLTVVTLGYYIFTDINKDKNVHRVWSKIVNANKPLLSSFTVAVAAGNKQMRNDSKSCKKISKR
jgi:hypothetical protein